ncbi:DEAD/DEAH box helicase [Flavobacterium psychrophilum]|uniref:DEAD/DEAH box helicase n=1 Tax=Flavobacterium psychrophilum TaxID=96345 RepID=UPI001C8F6C77|nr:DEAD/DEAH box helicase [Flavobacterium psychrophilum]EKT4499922.1 DEAD/DEAH box helicase [Flavobacterium psychrophilum]ELM3651235.1 DEAD/DEAH box helicase [Flavobacterium psychrophilum]ELM3671899.1 DEAD/DEAH box helicase [Flavobacterium psychrophilum]ELM3725862.1 DEAD/DEAH box helicase [Flavobacterium psychrophilum]ELY1980099.1 DEAD/DEAH box helicase [Flavobacterium psychrophilum]
MSFDLLSEPIRKFIRDKGWEQLRPIQTAAIAKILASDDNFILASRTASGKTEAAFLPILSKVNFNESGVQVLYISPLIALINDQFYRIEELCKNLDVTVTKWHGEANKTLKERLIKQPNGIVLITPESLEAMFVNKPYNVKQLFSNLKYVVIDEIHSFIGTDRGIQLKSILSRLQKVNSKSFSIVGLSATIGDYDEAKKFTGDVLKTKVLLDRTAKEINALFRYFKNKKEELPLELLKDLYIETKDNKVLIFPNSRGRAEEVAVKLRKISDRVKGHPNYFSHHSSVDREVREYVEYFAKNNNRKNFCISCTSTLELGIDIGTVDEVVQIDATHSIASLIQRVGRSGRKEGESSNLYLYATNEWSLLQSIACWLLYKEGFIEPPQKNEKPYDILVHQALSITKGHSGIRLTELINQLKENAAFKQIELSEIDEILKHLIEIDFLEKLQHEVIIGVEGEKVVNSRNFYSVFKTEENFKVVNAGNAIGEIPFSPQIIEDENILLSAKIWKIKFVDHKAKKIEVIPTKDGKKPMFFGGGATIHQRIREKMFEVLYSKTDYDFLDQPSCDETEILRKGFSVFNITDLQSDRPLLTAEKHLQLFTFTGTRINRTIQLLLNIVGIKNTLDDSSSSFDIEVPKQELISKWSYLSFPLTDIDTHISTLLQANPALLDFSKWGTYLPDNYKIKLVKDRYFDIEQTAQLLRTIKLIENE